MQVNESINLRQLISLLKVDTSLKTNGSKYFRPNLAILDGSNTGKTDRLEC